MTKASERLSEVIKSLDSDSCIISLSIPSQEDKIVVFTQYFDDNEDTWKSVPGKTHIFSESSFTHWLRIARTHPVTRDNIDAPKLHNGMRTRIKYCKVQENDTGYYCPELRDLANYFLDIINETTHSAVSRNRQTEINTTNHQEERQKGACVSLAGIFYINRRSDQHHNDSDEETASPGLN